MGNGMRVKFSKRALKFLDRLKEKDKEKVRLKLKVLITSITDKGIIPFKKLKIKQLKGEWKGFLRMRSGKIRIIFRIDKEEGIILIYDEIDFRGDIYKNK